MPTIKLHISSKQWEKAPIDIKENGEEIRILTFKEDEFFFEDEKDKVLIQIGFGHIAVDWERFQKELNEFLGRV